MKNTFKLCAVVAVVLLGSVSLAGAPLFPYQGLDKNGAPQNGPFTFRFGLFSNLPVRGFCSENEID